jgi:hypothetical protein
MRDAVLLERAYFCERLLKPKEGGPESRGLKMKASFWLSALLLIIILLMAGAFVGTPAYAGHKAGHTTGGGGAAGGNPPANSSASNSANHSSATSSASSSASSNSSAHPGRSAKAGSSNSTQAQIALTAFSRQLPQKPPQKEPTLHRFLQHVNPSASPRFRHAITQADAKAATHWPLTASSKSSLTGQASSVLGAIATGASQPQE